MFTGNELSANFNTSCCKEEIPLAACRFPLKFFTCKYFFLYITNVLKIGKLSLNHTQSGANGIFLCLLNVLSTFFFVTLKGNVLEKNSSVSSVLKKKKTKKEKKKKRWGKK